MNILLVEDTLELLAELRSALPPLSTIRESSSAAEAILYLAENAVDLVITDMTIETGDYKDGLSVIEAARARDPDTQVIAVTSFATREISIAAIRHKCFDFLDRNYSGIDFLEKLRWKVRLASQYREALRHPEK